MTLCTVTCDDCGKNSIPKVWRWLCQDCAEEHLQRHRADTGHDPQLYIPAEVTTDTIRRDFERARRLMRRGPRW